MDISSNPRVTAEWLCNLEVSCIMSLSLAFLIIKRKMVILMS